MCLLWLPRPLTRARIDIIVPGGCRNLQGWLVGSCARKPGPPERIDGMTVGVVTITDDGPPPQRGEVHSDGDEILYVMRPLTLDMCNGGRRSFQGIASSRAAARCRITCSAAGAVPSCTPIGRADECIANGNEIAGVPVMLCGSVNWKTG